MSDYVEKELERRSTQGLLKCRGCHTSPKWFRPGHAWIEQDEDGCITCIEVACPICGVINDFDSTAFECGGYYSWNGKLITEPPPGTAI